MNQPINSKPSLRLERNKWARTKQEKCNAFADHLAKVFVPTEASPGSDETDIDDVLQQDFQLDLPLKVVTPGEVTRTIQQLYSNKAPGFDLIDKKILSELRRKELVYIRLRYSIVLSEQLI